jgi:hypothetical protein
MSTVLAGDSLPVGDVQRIYSAHSGASAGTLPHFTSYIFNEWVMPELGKMFTWFRETVRESQLGMHFTVLTTDKTKGIPRR